VTTPSGVKSISLALQGGGSHGAFTWGVLERVLSDRRLRIDGISGTSAGAMNAVLLVHGFIRGGRQGAIDALAEFWFRVSECSPMNQKLMSFFGSAPAGANLDNTPYYSAFDLCTRMFSPYELNPFDINPLRDLVEDMVDFNAIRNREGLKIFVTATNVRSSKPKVFRRGDLSVPAVMASACVPLLFKAVEIDGEHYWDGGYMGNPSIYPLVQECQSSDVVIVQINTLHRNEVPTKARDILNRITELSFNSSLVREMRGFATITSLIDSGKLDSDLYSRVYFHMVGADEQLPDLGVSSKFNTDFAFLKHLHGLGLAAADRWLEENFDSIGKRSSLDVFKLFM
jgi:NTE family protein